MYLFLSFRINHFFYVCSCVHWILTTITNVCQSFKPVSQKDSNQHLKRKYWLWRNLNTLKMRLPNITLAKINVYLSASKASVRWGKDKNSSKQTTLTGTPRSWRSTIISNRSLSRHPRLESIPPLLIGLVGKRQETWPFLAPCFLCPSVCAHISHQRGEKNPTFVLFLFYPPPHDTPPVFLGACTTQTLVSKPPPTRRAPCHYAIASVIPTWVKAKNKKLFIVFRHSCHGMSPHVMQRKRLGGS